jgi:hypothetical protein
VIKVPITYTNFDDEVVTEVHYFHLSKTELIKMETGDGEAMSAKLERVSKSANGAEIMRVFQDIIEAAYGERVAGSGSEFYKSPSVTAKFMGSLAFDQLLTDLLTNVTSATDFINGLMPKDLDKLAAAAAQNQPTDVPLPGMIELPDTQQSGLRNAFDESGNVLPWAFREPTQNEQQAMNSVQMRDVYRRKASGWQPPAQEQAISVKA